MARIHPIFLERGTPERAWAMRRLRTLAKAIKKDREEARKIIKHLDRLAARYKRR